MTRSDVCAGVARVGALALLVIGASCDDAGPPGAAADTAPTTLLDAGRNLEVGPAVGGQSGGGGVEAGAGGAGGAGGAVGADAPVGNDAGPGDTAADAPLSVDGPGGRAGKLDLVFMIDNSNSMAQKQQAMRAAFPALIQALAARPGGLPDLHIAIISSNVGAGPGQPAAECPPGGDRGSFQILQDCGVDPAALSFLSIDGSGQANFPGGAANLATTFQCLAQLGTKGCGYEHQLLSLYFALDGKTNGKNRGFLRDDAVLGVVLLSDEDDCSGAPDANFFDGSVMGQSGSLRCALLGHVCNAQPVPAMPFTAPLAFCAPYQRRPGEEKSRLVDVKFFVDALTLAKAGRADRIFVASIIGWSEDPAAQYSLKQVNTSRGLELDLAPICSDPASGTATPAIRLHSFAKSFPHNGVFSICASDLGPPMTQIGNQLSTLVDTAQP